MLIWHTVSILAVQALSSGRAAILGYTMPVFTALWGRALFGERLTARQLGGMAAAAIGVGLLLWHELAQIAGRPWGAFFMLMGAAVWGLGTQQMRRTHIAASTLALSWWMSVITLLAVTVLAVVLERDQWAMPPDGTWFAIGYNALLIFGFSQPAWLLLARTLPPAASSRSVMMIPVLGALSGAWWLGEALHWQDGAAMVLMGVAIASVLWPRSVRGPDAIRG
jgi:drug/metabolite transporter (DMT)-like permease